MKSCACCGIWELVEKKPNEIGAYTSKEYQWTVHTTNEKEFLEQFAFIEGTEPLRYQNYFTYKNKNYYLMEITGN